MTYIQLSRRLMEVASDVLNYADANCKIDSEVPYASSFYIDIIDILGDGDASCLKD